ncbi:MAG: hypothetical protein AAFU70_00280 [Planctomycetota bacterium]
MAAYLDEVAAVMQRAGVDADEIEATVAALEEQLLDRLASAGGGLNSAEAMAEVIATMDPPECFAPAGSEAAPGRGASPARRVPRRALLAGAALAVLAGAAVWLWPLPDRGNEGEREAIALDAAAPATSPLSVDKAFESFEHEGADITYAIVTTKDPVVDGPRRLVVVDPTGETQVTGFLSAGYEAWEVVLLQPVPDRPPTLSQEIPAEVLGELGLMIARFNRIPPENVRIARSGALTPPERDAR